MIKESIRSRPAFDRARRFLLGRIETCARKGDAILPNLQALVGTSGVSRATLHEALGSLVRQGAISPVPAGGYVIRRPVAPVTAPSQDPPADTRPRWEKIRSVIADRIRNHVYPPGSMLPLHRGLATGFGAAHVTVRRALLSLEREGKLEPFGRGFRVRHTPALRARATLVLIARMQSMRWLMTLSPRSGEFWRELDAECRRLNIDLELAGYESHSLDPKRLVRGRRSIIRTRRLNLLGYLVINHGFSPAEFSDLAGLLEPAGRPVAVFDDVGTAPPAQYLSWESKRLKCRFFTVAVSETAGREMGYFLLSLGHRRIACFTLSPDMEWCRARLAGIRNAFTEAGFPAAVQEIPLHRSGSWFDMRDAMQRDPLFRAFGDASNDFILKTAQWFDDGENFFYNTTAEFMAEQYFRVNAEPLFQRALADQQITAWVGINDVMALVALEYLRSRGIRMPRHLSLAGFDDTPEAFGRGLSSFNFNIPAIVRQMLEHILRPSRREGAAVTEVPGFMVQRMTTGKAQMDRV